MASVGLVALGVSAWEELRSICIADDCTGREPAPDWVPTVAKTGAVLLGVGLLVGLITAVTGDVPEDLTIEERLRVNRERALSRTEEAVHAARSGDCATVRIHARAVQFMDAELYATVFVRDVAIQRCLAEKP